MQTRMHRNLTQRYKRKQDVENHPEDNMALSERHGYKII